MLRFGIAASLLSLGAIDFGMIVDSSVVMVENCVRHLAPRRRRQRPMIDVIRDAAVEVRKPTLFGELIIMIVYLPILTLEGIEGKAVSADGADGHLRLIGSMILSLTLMPVLASLLLPRHDRRTRAAADADRSSAFTPDAAILDAPQSCSCIGFAAVVLFVAFGLIAPNLGSEFVPRLSEGAIAISVVRLDRHRSGRLDPLQHDRWKRRCWRSFPTR